jgi:DNA-binding response OmpR family regulator
MQVLFCHDGEEVLVYSIIDPFDCIIIDCNTSGMDGIDLIKRLRRQFAFAIIIGLCKEDRGTAYLQAGANDFLQNLFVPYRPAMMLDGRDILSLQRAGRGHLHGQGTP